MGCLLCQACLGSRAMECTLQAVAGDLFALEQSISYVMMGYCVSILWLHSWCLACLTCQKVFLNCNMPPNDFCQCKCEISIANTHLILNLDGNTSTRTHFKPVFLCLLQQDFPIFIKYYVSLTHIHTRWQLCQWTLKLHELYHKCRKIPYFKADAVF